MTQLTPMMQQYYKLKDRHKDSILFFRMGDFYEMFGEDAKIGARELQIALTARNKGEGEKISMAGVPVKAADSYIARLIQKGYRVAIGEQIEDPKESKGLVARDVVQVITPGTITHGDLLMEKENKYLAALTIEKSTFGLAYIDVSTGDFLAAQMMKESTLKDEILRIQPAELLIPEEKRGILTEKILSKESSIPIQEVEEIEREEAKNHLTDFFGTTSLSGFGLSQKDLATEAAAMILLYLKKTQQTSLKHITCIATYSTSGFMELDETTRRNLELTETIREKKREGSLLWVLDKTITAMGGRTLFTLLEQPLLDLKRIRERLSIVEDLVHSLPLLEKLKMHLKNIYDLQRLMSRISLGRAQARDLLSLKDSLKMIPEIKRELKEAKTEPLKNLGLELDPIDAVASLIERSIQEDPPTTITEGHIIRQGFHEEVDTMRRRIQKGQEWIAQLERSEKENTGIQSLKVRYNKVFGYYIEVTKTNLHLVPEHYQRRQTLSNCERYSTQELKEREEQILKSQELITDLEYRLFTEIREEICTYMERIQESAHILSYLDVYQSLATVALENHYTKPTFNRRDQVIIREGRHPVVEKKLTEIDFIPNDTKLEESKNRFLIITGPNMSGKSTYMRQVALITLMAQIGSFVPAKKASLRIMDRIFTRVGASDDLATGQSTFMVEMNEVANILHNSTPKSLILLDEVGRGTATFDGLSIAWAITEYLMKKRGGMTLFATHYHELTDLASRFEGIENYRVAVEEKDGRILFLHHIIPGTSDESYGLEVAKLAGLPKEIIARAGDILESLKKEKKVPQTKKITSPTSRPQLSLFSDDSKIRDELMKLDIDTITPREAIDQLYLLQDLAKEEENP